MVKTEAYVSWPRQNQILVREASELGAVIPKLLAQTSILGVAGSPELFARM